MAGRSPPWMRICNGSHSPGMVGGGASRRGAWHDVGHDDRTSCGGGLRSRTAKKMNSYAHDLGNLFMVGSGSGFLPVAVMPPFSAVATYVAEGHRKDSWQAQGAVPARLRQQRVRTRAGPGRSAAEGATRGCLPSALGSSACRRGCLPCPGPRTHACLPARTHRGGYCPFRNWGVDAPPGPRLNLAVCWG